jgi:hypothetical protein
MLTRRTVEAAACLAGAALVIAACGQSGGASRSPSPTVSAAPTASPVPAEQLFAVTEHGSTVALVGLDGRARAKATCQPAADPWINPDFQLAWVSGAVAANGRAYYLDLAGVVRSLGPAGDVRQETRFPITNLRQRVSFAVSPDGRRLIGAILTVPPKPDPVPASPYRAPLNLSVDVMTASAGSPASVTFHQDWTVDPSAGQFGGSYGGGPQFVGWAPGGPVAVYPTRLGQLPGFDRWHGATLVYFTGGKPGSAVTIPSGSTPMDVLSDGTVVSTTGAGVEVRASNGGLLWQRTAAGHQYVNGLLSPDAQHVAVLTDGSPQLIGRDGSAESLPRDFISAGWLDSRTVVGYVGSSELGYVGLDELTKAIDLGFQGSFVGRTGTIGSTEQ